MPEPTYTPTTGLGRCVYCAAHGVAGTALFQTLTGAANETAAMASVYLSEADESSAFTLPIARVWLADGAYSLERKAVGGRAESGTVTLDLELIINASYRSTPQDEVAWLLDQADTIVAQMIVLGQTGGNYLNIMRATLEAYGRIEPDKGNRCQNEQTDQEHAWVCRWRLDFP